VPGAIEDAERDRTRAAVDRRRAGEELTATQLLFAHADGHEDEHHAATADQTPVGAELAYDSAERRRRFADSLTGVADQKVIDVRILGDGENVRHPREAVLTPAAPSTKATAITR
jgi:hypothetical protein